MVLPAISEDNLGMLELRKVRRKQKQADLLKKRKMTTNQYLKNQILNHDRMDLLMTEVLGYLCTDFHIAMWYGIKLNRVVIENQKNGKDQIWNMTLAPRGHGKSTILTISRCILEILKNPNIRILIASKTDDNAVTFLSEIREKLKKDRLVEIFGVQQGKTWNDGNIRVLPRTSEDKEDTVTTIGVGSNPSSRHYDLILADDLCDEENSRTDGQRDKIRTWFFKLLDPCLEPDGGEISIIGTRFYPDDLLGHLIDVIFTKKNKSGKVLKKYYQRYPALLKKRVVRPDWPEHKKWAALWPEKFSVKFLLRKRGILGSIIFNSQYQNDVEGMKGKIFKYEWFQWFKPDEINVSKLIKFQGVDLAIKQSENADKFAHVTIGIDKKTRNIYVLDYYDRVTHYNNQKKVIKENFEQWDPVRVGIESNGYQLALIQDMQTDKKLSKIRAVPVFTDKDKTARAWKLSAYFERGQVYLQEGMHHLMEHMMKMPSGRYKDLFDALDIAINLALGGAKKPRDKEPGLI